MEEEIIPRKKCIPVRKTGNSLYLTLTKQLKQIFDERIMENIIDRHVDIFINERGNIEIEKKVFENR